MPLVELVEELAAATLSIAKQKITRVIRVISLFFISHPFNISIDDIIYFSMTLRRTAVLLLLWRQ